MKPKEEIKDLSIRLEAMSDLIEVMHGKTRLHRTFAKSAEWLAQASWNTCGAGYIGCNGGPDCDADESFGPNEEKCELLPVDLAEDIRRYFAEYMSSQGYSTGQDGEQFRLAASIKKRLEGGE